MTNKVIVATRIPSQFKIPTSAMSLCTLPDGLDESLHYISFNTSSRFTSEKFQSTSDVKKLYYKSSSMRLPQTTFKVL